MTFPLDEPEHNPLPPANGEQVEAGTVWVRMRLSVVDDPKDWPAALALTPDQADSTEPGSKESRAVSEEEIKRQVREQLANIIDLIQYQATVNVQAAGGHTEPMSVEDLRMVDELVADPQKFDELIQRIVDEGTQSNSSSQVQAEAETEETSQAPETDSAQEGRVVLTESESAPFEADSHWDFALDLPAFLAARSEATVYEMQGGRAQLYILCEQSQAGGALGTVQTNEEGELFAGVALKTFVDQLAASFPAGRVQWVLDGSDFLHTANFSEGLDRLDLDPAGRCAALVELPMSGLPGYMRPEIIAGEVQAAPADKGWSLLQADSLTLSRLIQTMNVPTIVAEKTFFAHNLSFVLPSQSAQGPAEGSVTDWVNRALGAPDNAHLGAVLTFSWSGIAKRGAVSLPFESPLGDMLWSLPGRLPNPHQDIVTGDNLDQLIWLYGLDEQASRRLTNYVMDGASAEGLESALHALELPDELLKVIDGSVLLADFVGYREFSPQMSGLDRLKESVTAYPNGTDRLSAVSRELIQRPWLAAADGFAQLGASGLLAVWATRRLLKGQPARAAAVSAAALGASGAAELVLARAYSWLHQVHPPAAEQGHAPPTSILDELQAQKEEAEQKNPHPLDFKSLKTLSRRAFTGLGAKARRAGQKYLGPRSE
ncbi:hypothetical protein ACN08Y_06450 [Rothia sp. P5764]|uniref:hypothetical protein n=1 Tax=Rothia sp. P5764 TaxID=3402654 RepID=UPI003AC7DDEF